jgi:hypothetical protein
MGPKADLLGVDDAGRLLVIEAKPPDELKGIVWAPVQLRFCSRLFAMLYQNVHYVEVLEAMLDQRVALELTAAGPLWPYRLEPSRWSPSGRASQPAGAGAAGPGGRHVG